MHALRRMSGMTRRTCAGVAIALLTVLLPASPSSLHQVRAAGTRQASCATKRACQLEVLALLNAARAKFNIPPLTLDLKQTRGFAGCVGSVGHTRAMIQSGTIWHIAPKDSVTRPKNPASFPNDICSIKTVSAWGEDVGATADGQSESVQIRIIQQTYMSEVPHTPAGCKKKAVVSHVCNILDARFKRVGISLIRAPFNGVSPGLWETLNFIG